MGSRWLIRRFRTGSQPEPRGHVSSTRAPIAGVALASEGVRSVSKAEDSRAAERQRPSGRGPRARERRLQARQAQPPTPTGPTAAACARRAFRGTRVVARRNVLSPSSSSTTPAGPARPLRLASVPRPGMNNTDVRLGTHPGDQTRQGHPYARSITSRTLCLRLDRSADRFPLAPLRNGVAWPCGVDERGAAGTLPGAAQGRRIPDPVPSASGPQIAATAVERRRADAPGVAGTVPGVAGRVAGIAGRIRDRGVARAGLRAGSVGTGGCRVAQRLRA